MSASEKGGLNAPRLRTVFIVRIGNVPVRFGDRIETVDSDRLATRFDSHDEATKELLWRQAGFRGVKIIAIRTDEVSRKEHREHESGPGELSLADFPKRRGF
jgi:hypothetical protein